MSNFDRSLAQMDEDVYRPIYSLLLVFIESDWEDRLLGNHVRSQLEKAINSVRSDNHFSFLVTSNLTFF